jgi:hypothetical protein
MIRRAGRWITIADAERGEIGGGGGINAQAAFQGRIMDLMHNFLEVG